MRGTGTSVPCERAHHAELAIDRVRRRQQLGRRPGLGAHHVGACRRQQLVGRIRLAALELLDGERAGEAGQVLGAGSARARRCRTRAARRRAWCRCWLRCMLIVPSANPCRRSVNPRRRRRGQRSAIASSLSFDSTTSRVGSIRTAPSRSKPFSSWLTRWREAPSSCARSSCASCRPMRISSPCGDAVAAREQQDLLGQPRRERPGVQVLDGVEHQPQAPAVQAQQRLVQLDVLRQQLLEVGLAHDQQRGRAVRVGIVRARQAVEQRDVAEPGAGLDVGQRDLLARRARPS